MTAAPHGPPDRDGSPSGPLPAARPGPSPPPDHATPDHATPDHATPDHATPDHATPDHPSPDHPSPDHPSPDHPSPDHPSPDHPSPDHATEVDAAMAALDDLTGRPLGEHVAAFERVHAALGAALGVGAPYPGPV